MNDNELDPSVVNTLHLQQAVAKVKPGDELTAVFRTDFAGAYAVSGRAWESDGDVFVGHEMVRTWGGRPVSGLEDLFIHKAALEPEPPMGSVVIDRYQTMWQRCNKEDEEGWHTCLHLHQTEKWQTLQDHLAPIRVIWTPEQGGTDA